MDQVPENEGHANSGAVSLIVNAIGAYLGNVPAALQKNVEKAFGHLLRVPGAYNEGKAEEIKAYSQARVQIIKATGAKLAESIEIDSSLAQLATDTHANKILRHQKNAIGVLKFAAEELTNTPYDERVEPTLEIEDDKVDPQAISEDWLNAFESEAVNMSSEQMRKLFGKMLAGEIRRPSAFSIRTIKLMGQMDTDVAELFRKFCSIVSSIRVTKSIVVDGRALTFDSHGEGALHAFEIPRSDLLTLHEYGLITETSPKTFPYDMSVFRAVEDGKPKVAITFQDKQFVLVPQHPKTSDDFKSFTAFGIPLSRVGRELLSVVELEENDSYEREFRKFFETLGLILYPLPDRSDYSAD